jgi:hypothetical protein
VPGLIQINAGLRAEAPARNATLRDGVLTGGHHLMTMQSDNKGHGLANNLWAQLSLLAVAAVIIIVLAARYVW